MSWKQSIVGTTLSLLHHLVNLFYGCSKWSSQRYGCFNWSLIVKASLSDLLKILVIPFHYMCMYVWRIMIISASLFLICVDLHFISASTFLSLTPELSIGKKVAIFCSSSKSYIFGNLSLLWHYHGDTYFNLNLVLI